MRISRAQNISLDCCIVLINRKGRNNSQPFFMQFDVALYFHDAIFDGVHYQPDPGERFQPFEKIAAQRFD